MNDLNQTTPEMENLPTIEASEASIVPVSAPFEGAEGEVVQDTAYSDDPAGN